MKIRVWRTRPLSRRRVPGLPTRWARGEKKTGDRFNPAPHVKRVNPLARAYHTPLFVGLCCEDFSLFDAGLQLLRTREGFRQRMGYGMQMVGSGILRT